MPIKADDAPNAALDRPRVEWPTLLLAVVIYSGWLALTAFHASLPTWSLAVAGGWLIAWHGSLQHEVIHGHPTGSRLANMALGAAPLSLWLPYAVYRRSHLAHHRAAHITHPLEDPESHYVDRADGWKAWSARLESRLIPRLVLGPPIRIASFLVQEARRAWRSPAAWVRDWAPHGMSVLPILWWLDHVGLSVGAYVLLFVYPGTALTLLRSFAEHHAAPVADRRAAIVRDGGIFGLLFLNNHLHAAHHARPDIPWYRLPSYFRRHERLFEVAPYFENYGAVFRRFAWAPNDDIVHPSFRTKGETV